MLGWGGEAMSGRYDNLGNLVKKGLPTKSRLLGSF